MLGENQGLQCLSMYMPKNPGLPRTLICQIVTPSRMVPVRALVDPGSQFTAISKAIATKLGLKGPRRTLKMGTSGAQTVYFHNMRVINFKLASLDEKFVTEFNIEAITMPKVACDVRKINVDPQDYNHLKHIKLYETDSNCHKIFQTVLNTPQTMLHCTNVSHYAPIVQQ